MAMWYFYGHLVFYGQMVYFVFNRYIIFHILVFSKKNRATLPLTRRTALIVASLSVAVWPGAVGAAVGRGRIVAQPRSSLRTVSAGRTARAPGAPGAPVTVWNIQVFWCFLIRVHPYGCPTPALKFFFPPPPPALFQIVLSCSLPCWPGWADHIIETPRGLACSVRLTSVIGLLLVYLGTYMVEIAVYVEVKRTFTCN
jgi:hypothetical protein